MDKQTVVRVNAAFPFAFQFAQQFVKAADIVGKLYAGAPSMVDEMTVMSHDPDIALTYARIFRRALFYELGVPSTLTIVSGDDYDA